MNTTKAERKRAPEPSTTRRNRDWVMIVLGVCLTLLFLVGGYWSVTGPDSPRRQKIRGPVKDPNRTGKPAGIHGSDRYAQDWSGNAAALSWAPRTRRVTVRSGLVVTAGQGHCATLLKKNHG